MSDWLTPWVTPILVALVGAAALLVIGADWRVDLAALAMEYAAATALVAQLLVPEVTLVKLITGSLVVGILAITGWQVRSGQSGRGAGGGLFPGEALAGLPFRSMVAGLALVAALYVASQPALALPGLDGVPVINTASYVLIAFGLINLGLTEAPLRAGTALLTLLIGFEMFYAAVEPALAVVALLAGVEFAVALAVSHLALLWPGNSESRQSD